MSNHVTKMKSDTRRTANHGYDLFATLQHYEVEEITLMELGKLLPEVFSETPRSPQTADPQ